MQAVKEAATHIAVLRPALRDNLTHKPSEHDHYRPALPAGSTSSCHASLFSRQQSEGHQGGDGEQVLNTGIIGEGSSITRGTVNTFNFILTCALPRRMPRLVRSDRTVCEGNGHGRT